jgi:hypothetical protein
MCAVKASGLPDQQRDVVGVGTAILRPHVHWIQAPYIIQSIPKRGLSSFIPRSRRHWTVEHGAIYLRYHAHGSAVLCEYPLRTSGLMNLDANHLLSDCIRLPPMPEEKNALRCS